MLADADIHGESLYNSTMLAEVRDEKEASSITVMSDGALRTFPPGFTGRERSSSCR